MADKFEHRHRTIRAGFCYQVDFSPRRQLDGKIQYWQAGCSTLTTLSDPDGLTAIYMPHSTLVDVPGEYDPKFNLFWPRPDSDYELNRAAWTGAA